MRMFNSKNKKSKTVFIHIGFMKTGTSAIQSFLNSNEKLLKKHGFYYPEVNKKAMNYLGFSLLDEVPPKIHNKLPESRQDLYEKLKKEIDKTKLDKIILSTEAFSLITTNYFIGEKAPRRLLEFFKDKNYEFKIIAFIRRQDEYLESQYNQHIKTHNFWNLYSNDILAFYKEKKQLFNFDLILDRWAKYVGEDNIKLKVYKKNNNSVSEFLEILGINDKPIFDNAKEFNSKLDSKALDFMRIANKYEIEKRTAKQNYTLIKLIEDVLGELDKPTRLLNNKEANQIMEDFKNENITLSNKYLKGDCSWCLPNSDIADSINNEQSTITKEESIKIATHIWNYFQSKECK